MIADPRPQTFRSQSYREFIAGHPCVVGNGCQGDVVAAHCGEGAKALKAPDTTCIPLCFLHHEEQHRIGKVSFADKYSLDCPLISNRLATEYIDMLEDRIRRMA